MKHTTHARARVFDIVFDRNIQPRIGKCQVIEGRFDGLVLNLDCTGYLIAEFILVELTRSGDCLGWTYEGQES